MADEGAPGAEDPRRATAEPANLVMAQEVMEMLQLLEYDSKFCDKELTPIHALYFVYPAPNQAQQFKYFHQLTAWLLDLGGVQPTWKKYDNPATICTQVLVAIKEFGVVAEVPPQKLKGGHGEAVCTVLMELARRVFARKQETGTWAWSAPEWPDEALFDEADCDSEAAEVAEVEDQLGAGPGDDEEDVVYSEMLGGGLHVKKDEDTWFMANTIDPREWQLELERVTPQLRVQVQADMNDWRTHVQQTQTYRTRMVEVLPESSAQLSSLGQDLGQILGRVRTKEQFINRQFTSRAGDYRSKQRELDEVRGKHDELQEAHMARLEELKNLTEEYDSLKADMADRSQTVQDTAPLVKIKDAIKRLDEDIKQMGLRVGVVNHTLMQAKLRQRPHEQAAKAIDWEEED